LALTFTSVLVEGPHVAQFHSRTARFERVTRHDRSKSSITAAILGCPNPRVAVIMIRDAGNLFPGKAAFVVGDLRVTISGKGT
jgi:hypothetical protein